MTNRIAFILILIFYGCSVKKNIPVYLNEYNAYIENYKKGFLDNPRSPLTTEDLNDLDFYPADESWKLVCTCQKVENSQPFEMPTYSGVTRTYLLHSIALCDIKNRKISLRLYKNIHQPINPLYKNHLVLPFKDHTNGESTYGGGRYINLTDMDIINKSIEIDFNKSYNPWCAYSDGYNCPIPPKDNHIEMEVNAGEKKFRGNYKTKVLD